MGSYIVSHSQCSGLWHGCMGLTCKHNRTGFQHLIDTGYYVVDFSFVFTRVEPVNGAEFKCQSRYSPTWITTTGFMMMRGNIAVVSVW